MILKLSFFYFVVLLSDIAPKCDLALLCPQKLRVLIIDVCGMHLETLFISFYQLFARFRAKLTSLRFKIVFVFRNGRFFRIRLNVTQCFIMQSAVINRNREQRDE